MERQPVIIVMGHIDHGKSTLLDYIRKSNLVASEAGSITQHVRACEAVHQGKKLTLIDTPGHEAFSVMRDKGAGIVDLAILVVSAEDGVKPQTLEAKAVIEKHHLPYVVAINKIDQPAANPERVKKDLSENGIFLEGLGGEVPWVAVSAKTGEGVPELLDLILLLSEVSTHADAEEKEKKTEGEESRGFVLESKLDRKIGIIGTVVVRNGHLKQGDFLVYGEHCFKIRKLENFLGEKTVQQEAGGPGIVLGWPTLPAIGTSWLTFSNKKQAKAAATPRLEGSVKSRPPETDQSNQGGKEARIIITVKADTVGTLEAVKKEVDKIIKNSEVNAKVILIDGGVGTITENDIRVASAGANGILAGFNVKSDRAAKDLAEKYNLSLKSFEVIYDLNEWLVEELKRLVPKVESEVVTGAAKVIRLFNKQKNRQVIGCSVLDGELTRGKRVRISRREEVLGEGKLIELKKLKSHVDRVGKGEQCGVSVESRWTISLGDKIEVVDKVMK